MLGRWSLAALLGAAALGAQTDAAEARTGCRVSITATGAMYLKIVGADTPFPRVEYGGKKGPRFTIQKVGRHQICTRERVSRSDVTGIHTPGVDDRFYQIVTELYAQAGSEADRNYRDYQELVRPIQTGLATKAIRDTLIDVTKELIERYANPLNTLSDMPIAQDVAKRAVNLLVDAYLKGDDPGQVLDSHLSTLIDDLAKKTAEQAGRVTNDAVKAAAERYLKEVAQAIKDGLINKRPETQTVQVLASTDRCEYELNVEWRPVPGNYISRFTESCGNLNALQTVAVSSIALKPGDNGSLTVNARNVGGGPMPIASVDSIVGLKEVMAPGAAPAIAIAGGVATISFKAAKPRFDKAYPVRVQITTGGMGTRVRDTGWGSGTVTVLNVAPRLVGTVTAPNADPGQKIELKTTEITVIDDNADAEGCANGEVRRQSLQSTGHPAGLDTKPQFIRFSSVNRKSCKPATGTYVFDVAWSGGDVEKPHRHGTFTTGVTVSDNNSASDTKADMLPFEVNDVAPTAKIRAEPKNFFMVTEPTKLKVVGRIQDDNGADDIVSADLDARQAGGGRYALPQLETARSEDWIDIKTPEFDHPRRTGKYPIFLTAADEKHTIDPPVRIDIDVSNAAPKISGWGYIYEAGGLGPQRRRLCPGQIFTTGAIAGDREGHALKVEMVIKKDGAVVAGPIQLPSVPGTKNFVTQLTAPDAPGNYTIEFTAVETKTEDKLEAVKRTELLEVVACDEKKEEFEEWAVDVRVEPRTVCVGDRFEANPIAQVRIKGGEREHRLPDGHAVYGDAMLPFTGGRTTGFVAQGPVGVQSVDMSFDLGGGRMLAHQALVQIIECPGPSQPVAFADYVTTQAADQISSGNTDLADMWAGVCYAALELQPGFIPPQGRDSRAVAEVSQNFAKDAAELAGDLEERADDALQDYAKRQNKQAEALLDDDTKDARKNADKAADDLSEARRYSNQAAMYRFLERIFQSHASGNRLAARSDQTGPVDPRYCADRMAWFASQQPAQQPAQQRRPQSDASTQTRNQMLMQGLQGLMNRDRQHHGHPSGHSAQPGFGVQGLFGNN